MIKKGYWAGKRRPKFSGKNHPLFGKPRPIEIRKKISLSLKGGNSTSFKKGHKYLATGRTLFKKGHKPSIETRKKYSINAKKRFTKEYKKKFLEASKKYWDKYWKEYWDKKGIVNKRPQHPFGDRRYIEWRLKIFQRDNYTCQGCQKVGAKLQVHHIKSWSKFPKLRYDLNNGITLCIDCHKLTDNYAGKENKGKRKKDRKGSNVRL